MKFSTLRRSGWAWLIVAALGMTPLRADTTMRTHVTWKSGGMMPPEMVAQFMAMAKDVTAHMPSDVVLEMQGTKARTEGTGMGITILDLGSSQVMVLNPATKHFAALPLHDFLATGLGATPAKLPPVPPQAQEFFSALQIATDSHATGRTDTVAGVQVEEHTVSLTLRIDPSKFPPDPAHPIPADVLPLFQSPVLRLEFAFWTPAAGESQRVAALGQIQSFNAVQTRMFSPLAQMQTILTQLPPEIADKISAASAPFATMKTSLRTRVVVYLPIMAPVASYLNAHPPKGANPMAMAVLQGLDASQPLVEMDSEVSELSEGPLDAALFSPPPDYTAQPAAELMKSLVPQPPKR
ncbi:MAG TPA: hypothetical protein VN709_03670 [Terriglobales bacterium]|nr:hypothetical protein [Terriglobales bacterium]